MQSAAIRTRIPPQRTHRDSHRKCEYRTRRRPELNYDDNDPKQSPENSRRLRTRAHFGRHSDNKKHKPRPARRTRKRTHKEPSSAKEANRQNRTFMRGFTREHHFDDHAYQKGRPRGAINSRKLQARAHFQHQTYYKFSDAPRENAFFAAVGDQDLRR